MPTKTKSKTRLVNRLTVLALPRFRRVLALRDAGYPVPEIARMMERTDRAKRGEKPLTRSRIYRMIHQALVAREAGLI